MSRDYFSFLKKTVSVVLSVVVHGFLCRIFFSMCILKNIIITRHVTSQKHVQLDFCK